jgi:hypothetical protein
LLEKEHEDRVTQRHEAEERRGEERYKNILKAALIFDF